MRSLSAMFTALSLILIMVTVNAQPQGHEAHHPQQAQSVTGDTTGTMGMMKGGMMSSGMMSGQGMMQGGMMGNMMNMMRMMHGKGMMQHHGPMLRFIHQVQHLPGMKAKLDLSDDQLDQLKNIRANFLKRKADWQADIEKKEVELNLLLDKNAPADQIRKALKEIAATELEMEVDSYEAAQKMREVLTPEQREQLETACPRCTGQGMMGGMMEGMMK